MKILYVISELTLGGAQKQLVELAKQLASRGHEVRIYTLNDDVPRRAELAGSPVELIVDQKQSRLDLAVLRRLRALLLRWRPDIVHGFLFDGHLYSRLAAAGTGIAVLNSERSHNYRLTPVQRFAHHMTKSLARGVVANTHAGAAFARRLFGLPADDVHVVWNGVRVDEIERSARTALDYKFRFFGDARVKLACLVGAIKPAKDYHLALATAARLVESDPAWRVLFVGDRLAAAGRYRANPESDTGGYKAAVLKHYDGLGLEDRIKFAGLRTDVPAIVRQCDALYVTSEHEGFPNVVLEAMTLGVPVASTEYSDIRRILPCEWQVVSARSAESLADAIRRARDERESVAARQRQWVLANATVEIAATSLERIYEKYAPPEICAQLA
ncbi:MAG TPA: glycosyltransferase [Burkholderiales bacterium]|nr:glycosyltransferase [Burkholderiales bacterium]